MRGEGYFKSLVSQELILPSAIGSALQAKGFIEKEQRLIQPACSATSPVSRTCNLDWSLIYTAVAPPLARRLESGFPGVVSAAL